MGRSRSLQSNHGEEDNWFYLEEYHLQIKNPLCHHNGQWEAIWQPQFQRILPKLGCRFKVLYTGTPPGKRTGRSSQQSYKEAPENHAGREEMSLSRRATRSVMGLPNNPQNCHRRNPVCPSFWSWGGNPIKNWGGNASDRIFRRETEWWADLYEPRPVGGKKRRGLVENDPMPTKNHALLQQERTHEAVPSRRLGT